MLQSYGTKPTPPVTGAARSRKKRETERGRCGLGLQLVPYLSKQGRKFGHADPSVPFVKEFDEPTHANASYVGGNARSE